MADFSFSFDSDNPFAEPEQTPPKAPAPGDDAASTADSGSGASASAVAPAVAPKELAQEEFALDSFDFAFGEGASVNDSLPTQLHPPAEESRQLTPGEAAFAAFDFGNFESEENIVELEALAETETSATVAEPEIVAEPELVAEPEIVAESETFDPFEERDGAETVAEFEIPETSQEPPLSTLDKIKSIATARKTSDKSAPSDLEEFNSLTFDLGTPAGDTFDSNAEIESNDAILEDEPTVEEMLVAEPVVVEITVDEPFVEAEVPDEPVDEVSVPDAVSDEVPGAVAAVATLADAELSETRTEAEFRRLRTQKTLSVAILGASGIGKNHARWFHRHGCRIVGFLGTTDDSVAQTETDLIAQFDFQGNAYTDLEALLQNEKPDIVCVATPPPLHFSHVLQSLEAGAHVLCEKPLVYAPTRKFRENRDGAKELVKVAAKKNLNLGTQLQYGAATPILCKLAGLSPSDVGDFAMELETLNPNSPLDPRELWIDLGPHPISVAQMLAGPGAQLVEETIRFEPHQDDEKTEVLARFGINCADGRLLMVRAVVRALRGENQRAPRRRFSFNGHSINYAPLQSAKNGFQAQFVAPDGYASVYPDPVDYLIGNFVSACRNAEPPLITGDFGRENLEWMLKVGTPGETR